LIRAKASPEFLQKVRREERGLTINEAYNRIMREEKGKELVQAAKEIENSINSSGAADAKSRSNKLRYQLFEGDFREVALSKLSDNSVPLIFTDPMYKDEFLYLYKDLGRLADRVLWPGGSLVSTLVQSKEPMLYDYVLGNSNLKYWNRFIVKMQGPYWPDFKHRAFNQTKTLAWFVKGEKPINPTSSNGKMMFDFIKSKRPDKTTSELTQSTVDAEHVIGYLTGPNDPVLDPMMGPEATTGIAALKLGRRFIGIEIDPKRYELAQANITLAMNE
jgi:hypothetical protein